MLPSATLSGNPTSKRIDLKIAVNTRFLIQNRLEGIGWFTFETMKRMVKSHPEHDFYFIFDRTHSEEFIFADNVHPVVIGPPAKHPILWKWWFERRIPKVLKKIEADVFISPDGFLSLKTDVPTLLVIHDLAFEHFPEMVPKSARKFYKKYSPLYARKADRIATVSRYSKKDIVDLYGVKEDKIDVVYNGASDAYYPMNGTTESTVKGQYTNGKDYFLYAGSLHPRKNTHRLFKAFDKFKSENNSDVKLLIAGRWGWQVDEIKKAFKEMKHADDVIFADYLNQDTLSKVTASASAMVYPSLFEGFGIPVLEAMRCGTPVVTSKVSSMPEVAGEAAIMVDPESVDEIANAMRSVYFDKDLRKNLSEKSIRQAGLFSWDITAERLWEALEKVIEEG